jgi:hypothetical protein
MNMMSNNAPAFDPLECTDEEAEEMRHGYMDGFNDLSPPRISSAAYDHGRRNGVNDRLGVCEPDQRELARRYLARQRDRTTVELVERSK